MSTDTDTRGGHAMKSIHDIGLTLGTVFTGTGMIVSVSTFFLTIVGTALASIALVVWLALALAAMI
jgi:hypothetical protein